MFGKSETYSFESRAVLPDKKCSVEDVYLKEIIQKPELLFSQPVLTDKERYQKHRNNRELLTDKSKFLGIGNDGFVVSMGDPERSMVCVKYVWDVLDVYPGKNFTPEDLDPEIHALHTISERFQEIRSITRSVLAETGFSPLGRNKPLQEAAFQESARRILLDEKHNCYIPEVLEVDSFQETEDEGEEEPDPLYFLDEKYTTITMDNIKGLSIQDIILNYPDTKEYIDAIDIQQIRKEVEKAFHSLHQHKIKHQDVTIRNIMFDLEQKRPVIIDFGKSSYGGGDITEEDEMANVNEVLKHLHAFILDPEGKKKRLVEEFTKQAARRGI